jgi:D-proline reductase (dithiol) PrdB
MPRLDRLPEANRKNLLNLPVQVNETSPFVRLTKPLSACRVAIVTTAGLHRRGDAPFRPGAILQSHTSIGFDRVPIMRDLDVTFPLDRLRELAAAGSVRVASSHYSFMGALRDTARLEAETGPEVARRLRDDGTDVALITPT